MTGLGCLLFPLGGSLPCWLCTRLSGGGSGLLQQVLPQGLLPLSWGCGREPRHAGSGPNRLYVSAGEESAWEPTSVIHFLGAQGISLRVCGAENASQGPWEPGALDAALILGGQATAGGALQLPFPSL